MRHHEQALHAIGTLVSRQECPNHIVVLHTVGAACRAASGPGDGYSITHALLIWTALRAYEAHTTLCSRFPPATMLLQRQLPAGGAGAPGRGRQHALTGTARRLVAAPPRAAGAEVAPPPKPKGPTQMLVGQPWGVCAILAAAVVPRAAVRGAGAAAARGTHTALQRAAMPGVASSTAPACVTPRVQVYVPPHPLIKHWLAIMRADFTPSPTFRWGWAAPKPAG